MKQLLFITLLSLLSLFSYSNTYYLSFSGGNDANTAAQAQSQSSPWKTIDKIITGMTSGTIPAGSTILLKRGDAWLVPRNFIINRSLIFDEYGPGKIKPYITSLIGVTPGRWTLKDATTGVWETTDTIVNPLSNTLNMVTINGLPYAMGRTPNLNETNKGWLNYEAHTSASITDNQNPFTSAYNGAQIVIRMNHTNIERGTISTISGNVINFSTSGFSSSLDPANGWGYFVQNSLKCLDQFGEWYYNAGTKKLSVCVGPLNNPSSFNIQYPYLDTMIQPRASGITFKNIQITGANRYVCWNDWGALNNIWFIGCDFAYSGGDFVCMPGKIHSGIDSCTAIYANSNAFVYSFHDNGIYISNTKITKIAKFAGMLFKDSPNRYGHGIFYSGQASTTDTGLQAKNLIITDVGYAGIFLGDTHNVIENVYVDTACTVQDDGACVYIGNYTASGSTPKVTAGNIFRNCILLHAFGAAEGTPGNIDKMAHGLYFDDNTNNTVAINNTFAYNAMGGMFVHNANRNRVENNLSYNNVQYQFYMQDDGIGDSIYLDTVRFNKFIAPKSSQLIYYFALDTTSLDSKNYNTWGLINNNILATPFSTNIAQLNHFNGILFATYNLANWRSTWHYDLASTTMPLTITDINQINFVYNTSFTDDNNFSFPCDKYVSIENVSYFNSILLKPMSADVLFYNNP